MNRELKTGSARGPDGEGNLICVGTTRCQPTDLSVGQNLAGGFFCFFLCQVLAEGAANVLCCKHSLRFIPFLHARLVTVGSAEF